MKVNHFGEILFYAALIYTGSTASSGLASLISKKNTVRITAQVVGGVVGLVLAKKSILTTEGRAPEAAMQPEPAPEPMPTVYTGSDEEWFQA